VTGHCSSWVTQIDGKGEQEAKTYLGLLDTAYLFSYAAAMFISGIVAERVDLRYFLSLGMIFSGVFTALFGFAHDFGIHSLWYLLAIQIILGIFQATGWPGVVSVMANWFGKGRRGLIMGLWNSHTSLGNILGSLVAGAFVNYNWGLSFTVPGLIIAGVGFTIFLCLVPRPQEAGLASQAGEQASQQEEESEPLLEPHLGDKEEAGETESAISFLSALRIPGVMEFSLCLFFSKLVSYTFLYWLPNYIHSTSGVNAGQSAVLSTVFDLGGILGGSLAGLASDRSGKPASVCGAMLVAAIPSMFIYQATVEAGGWCPLTSKDGVPLHDECFTANLLLTLLTGVLVNGPYALITTAVSAELGQHPSLSGSSKALATVTAIIDGTGSVGAAIGPFLAGPLSAGDNWDNVFYMLMASDLMALIFLLRLVRNEVRQLLAVRRERRSNTEYLSINTGSSREAA